MRRGNLGGNAASRRVGEHGDADAHDGGETEVGIKGHALVVSRRRQFKTAKVAEPHVNVLFIPKLGDRQECVLEARDASDVGECNEDTLAAGRLGTAQKTERVFTV